MTGLTALENKLDKILVKKAPFQLPDNGRRWLVRWNPWINLVVGLFGLLAAKALWSWGHTFNTLIGTLNSSLQSYGVTTSTVAPTLGFFYWLSLIVLIAESVLLLMAVPGLMRRSKSRGWNLAFLGAIANLAYGVVYLFVDRAGTASSFVGTLISTLVGLYLLFQIRGYYQG